MSRIPNDLRKMKTHTIPKSHLHLLPFACHCVVLCTRERCEYLETEIHGKAMKRVGRKYLVGYKNKERKRKKRVFFFRSNGNGNGNGNGE